MLLGEFGLAFDDDRFGNGPAFEDVIANVPDADLVEMYSIVSGIPQEEILDSVEAEDAENWKQGYVRLFISHSAQYKAFVADVSAELAIVGIDGFVAHDSMTISKPWQTQIELALRSMQAFVAIVHPEFVESAWCNQEVGWALGRRVPKYVVRMGKDPYGFIGSDQWPSGHNQSAKAVAATIIDWAAKIPELNETMIDGLFSALGAANNYFTAEAAAKRIAKLGNLTGAQWDQLRDVYWSTDQVYNGMLPNRALEPFYEQHGKDFPPPKPIPPARQEDPWDPNNDETPF